MRTSAWIGLAVLLASIPVPTARAANLIQDGSFELTKPPDQFGWVFQKWGGWKYEGDCKFAVGLVAHTGKTSALLVGIASPKIRMVQDVELEPGRYKITAFIRGLDIGKGTWGGNTEFMFNGKYFPLERGGTFGWTPLTFVGELKEKKKAGPSFGLWAPGYFWIDDVTMEKVGDDVPLTEKPVLGKEESPIAPPADIGADAVRCPECGYRNMAAWKNCYACGTALEAKKAAATGLAMKLITSFEEEKSPFDNCTVVEEHATDGKKAIRVDKNWTSMEGDQDWTGYDYLTADVYTDSKDPIQFGVEIRDAQTTGYWDRVNYNTVIPPGASTVVLPLKGLYVGEKSRPGRLVILNQIKRLVYIVGEKPPAPVYIDNVRLERDESTAKVLFDGLYAFDFGTGSSPLMEGFTPIAPGTTYSKGRGYGLKDAKIWRAFDVLQPDPLYEDFICIEAGSLAVDVPNGKYHVVLNIDCPSGFWGENQVYRKRTVLAQDKPVVEETMDFDQFKARFFHFWNVEDMPTDNTFDKYTKVHFQEKTFDVDVTDGQLRIGFQGVDWACAVTSAIIYPAAKAAEGEKFVKFAQERRRWHFDNYFKRILHRPTGDPLPKSGDGKLGDFLVFSRDIMKDVYYNDTPFSDEIGKTVAVEAFAGQMETASVAVLPLKDLGKVTVTVSDLVGPGGKVPSSAVDVGFVSYRLSRVTAEGSVYTIVPRFVVPQNSVDMPKDVTRRFWLAVNVPADAKPGLYKGSVRVQAEKGSTNDWPMELTVHGGTLDPLDVPAGPWGYTLNIPWFGEDPACAAFNQRMAEKSLRKMREYGFTIFSGAPHIRYQGFKDGKPVLDFSAADPIMKLAKDLGFLAVSGYGGGVSGIDAYFQDANAMNAAGFKDYSEFIKAVYTEIQKHADAAGWLPVHYNLGDEPLEDAAPRAAENAAAYSKAFPKGPPFFSAATSFEGKDTRKPHYLFAKALQISNLNGHDEDSVKLIHDAGRDWAFYNGGNRWTFGAYLYKAVKQFDMKFRITWHWSCAAGDPFYALDAREDDYAFASATPDGNLMMWLECERIRAGVDDYRMMLTLARLAKEKAGTPAAKAADELIATRLAAFKLGQRENPFGPDDWQTFRHKLAEAIDALQE